MLVQPIRDIKRVRAIEDALNRDKSPAGRRRYLMFVLGVRLGRRIGDMLQMHVGDLQGRSSLVIREEKTGKAAELYIMGDLCQILDRELAGRDPDEWLFQSRQRNKISGLPMPVNERTMLRDMKTIARIGRLPTDVNLGTHTLRKTFGYHYYKATKDIGLLMTVYNHSSEAVTKRYIGIASDEIKDAFAKAARVFDGK